MSEGLGEALRLEMAELLKEEREVREKLELTLRHLEGPKAKLEKAKAILLKAKAAYEGILAEVKPLESDKLLFEGELQLLQEKKLALRKEARMEAGGGGAKSQAQELLLQMKDMGLDPAEKQASDEAKKAAAEEALRALKAKIKG